LRFFARGKIDSANPILDLQFQIRRARPISAKAEFEGVLQMFQTKAIRTSLVAAIQKGTMSNRFGHEGFPGRRIGKRSANVWVWREGENLSDGLMRIANSHCLFPIEETRSLGLFNRQ
jgi:hypothetical protein